MHILHVAARPEALPCREEEYMQVLRAVDQLLDEDEGSGGCIYIPGVPGTGRTATVHAVVRELKRVAERSPEPAAAYELLWEAVSGHDGAKDGHMKIDSVVLMDELDQLMTPKQDVVSNFFNWPTLAESSSSRLLLQTQLSCRGPDKIVHARLSAANEGLPADTPNIIAPDGVKFASMKVSISGDAQRALDICHHTVELVRTRKRTARTDNVREVITVMQNSPTAAYLRDLSFHERLMVAAMLKCIKKEGAEEENGPGPASAYHLSQYTR
ncbi:hypothetical protein CERSUDRAFT_88356 [Gelatoporia subvermispora B]|uniref:Origin recognition complex subunit 1 n=1 Tax=Ceriporiopsis subvermispora (strain B) TaxID=914234 RepID=M2P9F9_CERS8|nr:hypothetical protein CERSUDRAFT_88356 [Gelatoporia subvermispora B]